MTFIDPTRAIDDARPMPLRRRPTRLGTPSRRADEDGARRAFGADLVTPDMAAAGAAIEHLARIALG